MDRTERQLLGIHKWKLAGGKGTLEYATGVGKTRCGTIIIQKMVANKPDLKVIVVVPTLTLQDQWKQIIDNLGLALNCEVLVINTASKTNYECDLLIIDELHRAAAESLSNVFTTIKYSLILGLTATLERLDGRHELLKQYSPIVDSISLLEARANGWVSDYEEYEVILTVDNLNEYKEYHRQFLEHFAFFNYQFDLAMSMLGKNGYKARLKYRDEIYKGDDPKQKSAILKQIIYHATGFTRALQNRKKFIYNHPKKLEIAKKIIEARKDCKIITFSNNVSMAEKIGGPVYSGKDSKKKGRMTIQEFDSKEPPAILNTIQKANEGLDVKGLSVAIMLGIDSSKIKATQRIGRTIRKEGDKKAEIFNLIIDGTTELEWFRKSHEKLQYTIIDENGLDHILSKEDAPVYKQKLLDFTFRY